MTFSLRAVLVVKPTVSRRPRRRPQTQPDSSTPIFHLVLSIHQLGRPRTNKPQHAAQRRQTTSATLCFNSDKWVTFKDTRTSLFVLFCKKTSLHSRCPSWAPPPHRQQNNNNNNNNTNNSHLKTTLPVTSSHLSGFQTRSQKTPHDRGSSAICMANF